MCKTWFTHNFNSCQESSWELEWNVFSRNFAISIKCLLDWCNFAPCWRQICSLRYLLGIYFSSKVKSKVPTFILLVNPKWSGHNWRQQVKQVNSYHSSNMLFTWYICLYISNTKHTTSLEPLLFYMPELCRICVSSFVQPVMAWEATIQDLQTRLREAAESQFHFFRKKHLNWCELMMYDKTTRHHFFGLRNRNKSECRPRMLPRTAVIFLIPMRLTCGSLGSESSQTFAVLLVLASVPTIDEHIYMIIHICEHLHIYGTYIHIYGRIDRHVYECIYIYIYIYVYTYT